MAKIPLLSVMLALGTLCPASDLAAQHVYGQYYWYEGDAYPKMDASRFNPSTVHVDKYALTGTLSAVLQPGFKVDSWWWKARSTAQGLADFELLQDGGNSLDWEKDDDYGSYVYVGTELAYISYALAYEGGASISDIIYTNALTIASCTTSRTGYAFDGAWTNSTGKSFSVGSSVTGADFDIANHDDEAVVRLFPVWRANEYTVRFNGSGATGGTMPDLAMTYDRQDELTANAFTRTGHTFAGWATSSGGSVQYADRAAVRNLASENGAVVNLYAVWTAQFLVEWRDDSRFDNVLIKSEMVEKGADATKPETPCHEGYTFDGWTEDGRNITANTTIYAKYQANHYHVLLNANDGGKTAESIFDCTYGTPMQLPKNSFVRAGYAFQGWGTNALEKAVIYQDGATILNLSTGASVTLYAVWQPIAFAVRFEANGGTGTMDDQHFVYDTPHNLTPNAFSNGELDFLGWRDDDGVSYADGQLVSNLTTTADATVTLTARWAGTYHVTFDGNGATSGTMSPQTFKDADDRQNLTSNAYAKTGYAFVGWATNRADAAALRIFKYDGESVMGLAEPGTTLELFAAWQAITYYVAFDAGTGLSDHTVPLQTCTYDQPFQLPVVTNNLYNYRPQDPDLFTFGGWTNALGATWYADQAVVSNLCRTAGATNTLVAIWKNDAGDWSRHMHCTTLRWTIDHDGGEPPWQMQDGPDLGGSAAFTCVYQEDGSGSLSSREWLSALVKTNGTLSFKCRWRTAPGSFLPRLCVGFTVAERRETDFSDGGLRDDRTIMSTSWTNIEISVNLQTDQPNAVIHLAAMSDPGDILEIDEVKWTPEGGGVEPQPGVDNPTVTGISFENGKIVIRSTGDARFDYRVWSTSSLVPPNWQIEGASQTGHGEGQRFELPLDSSVPAKFYRVEVLKKQ